NEDCLIRLYAGERRQAESAPKRFFNLHNYGLQVDHMEDLGLAKVNANEIEFVLAPATEPHHASTPVFKLLGEDLVVWMLDYDCVRELSQDDEVVHLAVHAFYRNDPYFSRP
ncbi:hypothetical protein EJ02DRAFT_296657, partial [Clathrospora elynae]